MRRRRIEWGLPGPAPGYRTREPALESENGAGAWADPARSHGREQIIRSLCVLQADSFCIRSFYQTPVFGIDAQGSRFGRASPVCSNSIEMLSGERTNAMRPSRGGRLIVTPRSIRRWQVA